MTTVINTVKMFFIWNTELCARKTQCELFITVWFRTSVCLMSRAIFFFHYILKAATVTNITAKWFWDCCVVNTSSSSWAEYLNNTRPISLCVINHVMFENRHNAEDLVWYHRQDYKYIWWILSCLSSTIDLQWLWISSVPSASYFAITHPCLDLM